jgi:hypothetical protein
MGRLGWIFVLLSCLAGGLAAQSAYRLALLPAINLNHALDERWALNVKLESRPLLARGTFGEGRPVFQYSLTDWSLAAARKVGLGQTATFGYLLRRTRTDTRHRLFQQFSFVQRLRTFRLGHRLASDQTFAPGEALELRLRYRLSVELPLSGQQVDPREFYFKANQEQLHNFQGRNYDLELRLVPTLGYAITDRSKLETGLEYRIDDFLRGPSRSTFFWRLSWYRKW